MKFPHLPALQLKSLLAITALLASIPALAADYPGLPTRDQNPLLQGYFIPAMPLASADGWAFSQSLYITNTYQLDRSADEDLIIDVENTRLDIQASWARDLWRFNINIPFIRNSAGFLDQTIVGWHDFFGLPQGGRDQATNDRLQLTYQDADGMVINTMQGGSAIGDIQLAAGYQVSTASQLWLGVELAASNDPVISNQAADLALWYAYAAQSHSKLTPYGLVGLSFPGNDGLFKNRLKSQFLFGQIGALYALRPDWQFLLQADFHSSMLKQTRLDALEHSLQAQFGLRLPRVSKDLQLDLFFSEDIYPGHAPDITFGLRFSTRTQAH